MKMEAVCIIVLSILILGCTTSNQLASQPPSSNASNTSGVTVQINNYSFQPASIEVSVGTTVTWSNSDPVTHTATGDNGEFDTGQIRTGQNGSYTFTKAGTYTYHCSVHPSMKGTVIVK